MLISEECPLAAQRPDYVDAASPFGIEEAGCSGCLHVARIAALQKLKKTGLDDTEIIEASIQIGDEAAVSTGSEGITCPERLAEIMDLASDLVISLSTNRS